MLLAIFLNISRLSIDFVSLVTGFWSFLVQFVVLGQVAWGWISNKGVLKVSNNATPCGSSHRFSKIWNIFRANIALHCRRHCNYQSAWNLEAPSPPPLEPAITIPGKTVFYSIQHKYFWNRDSAASEWAFSYVYSILYIPLLHVKCLKKGIHQLENEWLLLSASLMQNLS